MWRPLFIASAVLLLGACRPAPSVRGAPLASSRDVLLAHEIASSGVSDAYQAVSQLRPEFLKRRGPGLISPVSHRVVRVFLDDTEMGGIDILRSIPIDQVTAIRYVDSSEAALRWGANHTAGVILVSTARTLR